MFLPCASVPNPMILCYWIVSSPTLHRLCTDFGTEAQGRNIGGRTDLKHRKIPFSQHERHSVQRLRKGEVRGYKRQNNVSSTTCLGLVSFANNSRLRGLKVRHLTDCPFLESLLQSSFNCVISNNIRVGEFVELTLNRLLCYRWSKILTYPQYLL